MECDFASAEPNTAFLPKSLSEYTGIFHFHRGNGKCFRNMAAFDSAISDSAPFHATLSELSSPYSFTSWRHLSSPPEN